MRDYNKPMRPEMIFVMDDGEAKQIATFYELIGELKDPGGRGSRRGALIAEEHPTHWVVCACYWGFKDAKDNGYSATFIPRDLAKNAEAALKLFLKSEP